VGKPSASQFEIIHVVDRTSCLGVQEDFTGSGDTFKRLAA
jgi:hypothetical protein